MLGNIRLPQGEGQQHRRLSTRVQPGLVVPRGRVLHYTDRHDPLTHGCRVGRGERRAMFRLGLACVRHDVAASRLRGCSVQYSPSRPGRPALVRVCVVSARMSDELTRPTASYPQPAELLTVLLMDRCALAAGWFDTPLMRQ